MHAAREGLADGLACHARIAVGPARTLQEVIAYSTEHKGSWWPEWIQWLNGQAPKKVKAKGSRVPGEGKLKPIDDAPGRYVRTR